MPRLLTAAVCVSLLLFASVPAFAGELVDVPAEAADVNAEPMTPATPAPAANEAPRDDAAPDEPVVASCENPDELPVLTTEGAAPAIATPSFLRDREVEAVDVLVDLSGAPEGATATVGGVLTWGLAANDYDLELVTETGRDVSEDVQPDTPAQEQVSVATVGHCETVTVSAIDFLAPLVADELELSLTLSEVATPQPPDGRAEREAAEESGA